MSIEAVAPADPTPFLASEANLVMAILNCVDEGLARIERSALDGGSCLSEHMKFLCELLIAATGVTDARAPRLQQRAAALVFSQRGKLLVMKNPQSHHHFLSAYATLPPKVRDPAWRSILAAMDVAVPVVSAAQPFYRVEEIEHARAACLGSSRGTYDFSEFIRNAPWLTRDETYAFTHRFFYATDYCLRPYRGHDGADLANLVEFRCLEAVRDGDIDLLLELTACYRSLTEGDVAFASLLLLLAEKLFRRDPSLIEAAHQKPEAFARRYHQAFVYLIMVRTKVRCVAAGDVSNLAARLRSAARNAAFVRGLRSLDIVGSLRRYAALAKPAPWHTRLLETYMATLEALRLESFGAA